MQFFVKINEENIKKVINNENIITYEEFNKHTNYTDNINSNQKKDTIFTDKQIEKLDNDLIKANFKEPLDFHISNFERNKIKWKKSKIRKLFYSIKEEKFLKDKSFINDIESITINLRENDDNFKSNFCLANGEFININKKKKLERYILFSTEFQFNLSSEFTEIFIDGTFKICPLNWYQLPNIFGYIENKNFYLPIGYILMSSKSEELYNEVFYQFIKFIKIKSNIEKFENLKVMCNF